MRYRFSSELKSDLVLYRDYDIFYAIHSQGRIPSSFITPINVKSRQY